MVWHYEYTARFGTRGETHWTPCRGQNAKKVERCLQTKGSVIYFTYKGSERKYLVSHLQLPQEDGVAMVFAHHDKYHGARHTPIAVRKVKHFYGTVKYKAESDLKSGLYFEVTNSLSGSQMDRFVQIDKADNWKKLCLKLKFYL